MIYKKFNRIYLETWKKEFELVVERIFDSNYIIGEDNKMLKLFMQKMNGTERLHANIKYFLNKLEST